MQRRGNLAFQSKNVKRIMKSSKQSVSTLIEFCPKLLLANKLPLINIIGNKIFVRTGVQKVCFCSFFRVIDGKNELFALLDIISETVR